MIGWLGETYPWVKAAHLIFVIFWVAGMFMLPRFFVYHHGVAPGSAPRGLWIDRERRLLRIIINPAMAATWLLGLLLRSAQPPPEVQSLIRLVYAVFCLTQKKASRNP